MLNTIGGLINMGWQDKVWKHRGIDARIEFDVEVDNVKAFHYVKTPDDEVHMLDISPYDSREETVNEHIDYWLVHGKFKEHKNG